jgi:hypothetical protein
MTYRKKADQKYIDWAIDQILSCKNSWAPENTFHIHGENERMFPIRIFNRHMLSKKART